MLIAHRIALDPDEGAADPFSRRRAGTARFAWNWALAEWKRQYEAHRADPAVPLPDEAALRRRLNAAKRSAFPWMYEVTKCAPQEAVIGPGGGVPVVLRDARALSALQEAGRCPGQLLRGQRGRDLPGGGPAPPSAEDRLGADARGACASPGKAKRVTVSREAGRWFASVLVETEDPAPVDHRQDAVGVDLGVKALAVLSTGETIPGPKAHRRLLAALAGGVRGRFRASAGARRTAGRRRPASGAPARPHRQYSPGRRRTRRRRMLATTYRRIAIEDLNVRAMASNRRLARSIMDGGFAEFRRQLEYKARAIRFDGGPGGPLVSLEQDLFLLRFGQGRTGAVGAGLPSRQLRLHPGQGPERRPQSREAPPRAPR